ncbi:MAG: GNAT family N-acetyltransferase [Alphaproteobacteria bacterium]|nr:GNAT family N-acetyltransferase [Alphaproteobacteria bacterium]
MTGIKKNTVQTNLQSARQPQPTVRLARTADEIRRAQILRYKVFYEEHGATPSEEVRQQKRDFDKFDDTADHVIVLADAPGTPDADKIVGTYRLLRQDIAESGGGFYSSSEYDLTNLQQTGASLLELGRSCVLAPYRTKPVLNLLWQGIADYVAANNIGILFGCASIPGTDIQAIAPWLSYLHHYHPTPENLRPRALDDRYLPMNLIAKDDLDERAVFASLPPLIKGYLRIGGTVGDGAVLDKDFNTIDVCIVMPTSHITNRYRKYYERKIQRPICGGYSEEGADA